MQDTNTRETTEHHIREQQLSMLLSNTRTTNYGNTLIALLSYMVLQKTFTGSNLLETWFVTLISLIAIRLYLSFQRNYYIEKFSLISYLNWHVIISAFLGVAWGALPLIQLVSSDQSTSTFVVIVITGIVAASVASLSVWFPALLFFILPAMTGLITSLVITGDKINIMAAIGFVIFTGIIASVGRNVNRNTRNILELQSEKELLIRSLSDEINRRKSIQLQLEEHQQHLEATVSSRTRELINSNQDLQKEIEERQKIEDDLNYLAHHDPLTNLPNRTLLIDRIEHAITVANREKKQLAILFLDLDRFKYINDSLGHSVGDALLLKVSECLKNILRESDTVARNGGDEFVVILEKIDQAGSIAIASQKIIDAITQAFDVHGHEIHIGVSIGVSLYPSDGSDPTTLIKNADTAMYKSKQLGGNNYQFYEEAMSHLMRERLIMETKLRSASDNNELFIVYQPQIDINTGKTIGFEALMRWNNPELGLVSPARFIPILEDTGLIYPVGEWLVRRVAEFIKSGDTDSRKISINLSALQCKKHSFVNYIRDIIDELGIDPGLLEFEMTESLLVEDFENTNTFLSELNRIGCTIALDDFGTGYTSMNYLTRLPIDIIKIDRCFVNGIESNDDLKSIVNAIITMSKSLNVSNIIEGVENRDQLKVIQELGGHVIQGFLFSKPLLENEVKSWLESETNTCNENLIYSEAFE